MNTHDHKSYLDIGRSITILDIERLLATTKHSLHQTRRIRLATKTTNDLFADIWLSILIGTFCKHSDNNVEIITWGLHSSDSHSFHSDFFNSLHGITASQLATQLSTDKNFQKLDCNIIERFISIRKRGILEPKGGTTRTLVEFDPQQPVALSLQDDLSSHDAIIGQTLTKRRLFYQLLLKFRKALEVGSLKRRISPVNAGAIGDLSTFIFELHDNAYEHGRAFASSHARMPRNIRFVRLKKHIANSPHELLNRTRSFHELYKYIQEISSGSGKQVFIEASVSDFGLGIVDHFLQSPAGRLYESYPRQAIVNSLLNENWSAKQGDPAAGYGIPNALISAKKMSGFVSLRTGEFWLAQSYSDPRTPPTLTASANQNHPSVTGTHWQFIWPNPI